MSTDIVSDRPTSSPRSYRWRVVDIVVASVLAVAAGLVFVLWNIASNPIGAPSVRCCRVFRHCLVEGGCSPGSSPPW